MQLEKLIPLLKNSIPNITEIWRDEVDKVDHLQTYRALEHDDLFGRGEALFRNLVWWLEAGAESHKAEEYFEEVGNKRFNEKFPLAEVIYAVYLAKKILWGNTVWKNQIGVAIESDEVFEFSSILNNYFDLANFFITRGYFLGLFKKIDENPDIPAHDIKDMLMKGKSTQAEFDLDDIVWRHV